MNTYNLQKFENYYYNSHWSKLKISDEDKKKPDTVFKASHDSLDTVISHHNAHATLYNSFYPQKDDAATELDIRLSRVIDESQFPKHDDITELSKWDIFINAIN